MSLRPFVSDGSIYSLGKGNASSHEINTNNTIARLSKQLHTAVKSRLSRWRDVRSTFVSEAGQAMEERPSDAAKKPDG